MSIIHVLDDKTINKIAAGEVVERPASVVKELVENSIDAGATKIEVEILAGGTSFMRVTDNGKGMSREDAELAILRHATSKIHEAGDLSTVGTLGFRGEALPTIAAVSRFRMKTREAGADLGTQVEICGGKTPDIRETGTSLGTTIQVEDLFFNTPARKKFLKTNHTEGARINDFIVKLALSHPEIAFRFLNNNKMALLTPGNGSLYDTVKAIYGAHVADALLALSFANEAEGIRIEGFITKPSMLKSSRAWQTLIVNGRIVESRALSKAIDNAYKSLVPKNGFPLAVLVLTVPPRTVDVNVHPQKIEMKFEDEGLLFKVVYKAVLDAVRPAQDLGLARVAAAVEHPETHVTSEPLRFVPATAAPGQAGGAGKAWEPSGHAPASFATPRPAAMPRREMDAPGFAAAQAQLREKQAVRYPVAETVTQQVAEPAQSAQVPRETADAFCAFAGEGGIEPIGQVDLTYIIARDAKGLYIVDQHAAHERILFDKFSALADGIPSQQLLVHQILSFDARESALIEAHRELFAQLGFRMEPSGEREFRLMEIPADVPAGEAEDIVREILVSLHDMHSVSAAELRKAALATTACRAAIKAGDELNLRQMQMILDALSETAYPFTCPHGRPTILKFSSEELAKMFKRTGFDLKKR